MDHLLHAFLLLCLPLGVRIILLQTPNSRTKKTDNELRRLCLLLHVWRKALDALDNIFALDNDRLGQQGFGATRGAAAQMAFAALGANQNTRPGQAEPF